MKSYDMDGEAKFIASQYHGEKEFWLTKLSGDWVKSVFPYDFERAGKNRRMDSLPLKFPEVLESRIVKAGNNSDSRLHMILAAGLVQLLDKYTGNEDIIIGIPIYKQEVEGDFVNTMLALRNRLDRRMSFRDLLIHVRQAVIEANEHLNYPIEAIPQELGISYSRDDDFPLFDIIVLLENIHNPKFIRHMRTNMVFAFTRTAENLEGRVEYNSFLYKKTSVERISEYFNYLLRETLFNPDAAISGISSLREEEKKQVLFDFNDTDAGYPGEKTMGQLFARQAEATPHHIALVCEHQQLTYKQLNAAAHCIAAVLIKKGVKVNTVVGIMGRRSLIIAAGILGILKAGGTYLPLNAKDPDERIRFILEDSGAGVLITHEHLVENKPSLSGIDSLGTILWVEDLMEEVTASRDLDAVLYRDPGGLSRPDDNIYVIYTSGTTGKPKGAAVRHRNVVNYCCWAARIYVNDEKVDFPLYTSIAFDLTVTSLFTPLITGNAVVVYEGDANEALIERVMAENRVGVVKLTPSHLKLISGRDMGGIVPAVKRLVLGGEALETRLAKKIHENFKGKIEIYNEYGPTETTVGSMIHKFDPRRDNGRLVPIGKPIANTQIYLLNRNREPVPVGAVGEIYISGDGVAAGYYRRPRLTAEHFIPNPFIPGKQMYRTGDLGRRLDDQNIQFLGRVDNQVKIRGYRVETGEIERCLLTHEQIKEAVVIAREDKGGDAYLCAYMVSVRELPVSELREYLSLELPDYMIPSYFVTLDKIPLTSNGKVDKKALPEPQIEVKTYKAPGNDSERRMVKIWSEILYIEEPGLSVDANFFEVGGHSLSATILMARIHKEFNVKLQLVDIFKHPTAAGLAELLKGAAEDIFVPLEAVENKEYHPLSSAQKRLYILQQLDKESTAYNIPLLGVLEGAIDIGRLEDTFVKMIKRHESLRTSFELINEKPVQKIHDSVEFELEYVEPRDRNPQEIIKNFVKPFDPGKPPLVRMGLIKEEEERCTLVFDMHHIVTDGISMGIMMTEFMALYAGETLSPLKNRYKDYAHWQTGEMGRAAMKKQEEFWLNEFRGDIPVLDIADEYKRPEDRRFEGRALRFTIGKEESALLKSMALEQKTTLFAAMFAIYNVLLFKISGQEDIIIGTAAGGRNHPDLEPIIGMFINTLALRNYPNGEKRFDDFLKEVNDRALKAFDNQDYQFEDLVAKLGANTDRSRNPLFDVFFLFQNVDIPVLNIPGLKLTPCEQDIKKSKFDLRLSVEEAEDRLNCEFVYSTRLFKKETIEKYSDFLQAIVSRVLENQGTRLSEIEIISRKEEAEILSAFSEEF